MKASMFMEERQKQEQKQKQLIVLSSNILQMSAEELNAYLEEFHAENPLAELDYTGDYDNERVLFNNDEDSNKIHDTALPIEGESLYDYMVSQLPLRAENKDRIKSSDGEIKEKEELSLLKKLIGCLDEQGYLRETDEELCNILACSEAELKGALGRLQSLIPAGIGARNLSDCIMLQLKRLGLLNEEISKLIESCLPELACGKYREICKKMNISPEKLKTYRDMICHLNPRPGIAFSCYEQIHYVIPDVIIAKFEDSFEIGINCSHAVSLKWNEEYLSMYKKSQNEELRHYFREQITSMRLTLAAVKNREEKLIKICTKILERQKAFFLKPDGRLSPLSMSELAKSLSVDVSTVSRTLCGKYLQCSRGTFPLKFFVTKYVGKSNGAFEEKEIEENRRLQNKSDNDKLNTSDIPYSVDEIKEKLCSLLKQENALTPLSDQRLMEALKCEGCILSRRTVAKYRTELGFPNAANRKILR